MSYVFKHGLAGYRGHACRCETCRAAHLANVRGNRAARLASGKLSHGKRSAYDAGCRCDECKGARRTAYVTVLSEYPQQKARRP